MIKKFLAAVICCCLAAVSIPITTAAAQGSATLSAGRVYTFSNSDERTVSYVSLSGTARYEYVVRDAAGEVADFGTSTGRFGVRGGGTTTVSLLDAASASVTYDNGKISVSDTAGTALTRVSVAEGESIRLTNNGDQGVRVAVDNTGRTAYARYDIAVSDHTGAVTFFADASRYTTISLPAGGAATLTPAEGGLALMYPAAYASDMVHSPSETPALVLFGMEAGKTYTVANTDPVMTGEVGVSGGVALTYDYIRRDRWGYTVDYRRAATAEYITAEAGDVLYITPDAAVTLVYPALWQAFLSVSEGGDGRLISYPVAVGETLTLENTDAFTAFTFRADPADPAAILDYTFAGGPNGDTDYAMGESFSEMTLDAGYTWTLTVAKGASLNLWLPAAWLAEGLRINGTADAALDIYTLMPGKTLRLFNNDRLNDHTISLISEYPGREALYDYAVTEQNETRYGIDCRQGTQTLPADGTLFITAGRSEPLTVWLPAAADVAAQVSTEAAVSRYSLGPGASVMVGNTSETRAFSLMLQGDAPSDYVLKDGEGQVTAFGSMAPGSAFTVDAGGSALLTNTDTRPIVVAYPQSWRSQGVSLTKANAKALYRQTFDALAAVDVTNTNKRYARSFIIESVAGAILPVQYDYVQRSDRSAVLDYGVNGPGTMTVPAGGRITLMAQKGVTLGLCYPAEWQGKSVKLSDAADAPLYRMTLKPGERRQWNNRSQNTYEITVASGAYYIRYNNDNSRITASERPSAGAVNIPASTSVTLTAATGADVELVMPREWAARLGV